jgi:protoporphyrinogen oxidase
MNKKLTIIGGGITGLSAAYLAAKDGWEVTVLESSAQPGGLIRTFQIGENRLEYFYHHFFTNDAELLWLLKELGISNKLEFKKTTMGIFRNNNIYDFNGLGDLLRFRPMGMLDKARFILSSTYLGKMTDWRQWEHIPAVDWFYKYAGKRATNSIWKPLLDIKFGPYAQQVPAAWIVGRIKQRMNSRKRTEERLGYIKGSTQTLIDALLKKLETRGVSVVLNACVDELLIKNSIVYGAKTMRGTFTDGVILATLPTTSLIPMLRDSAPDYAARLSWIEYLGAVCVILETDRPLSNIYWLNIADPGFPFGGIIEHTNFISPDEYNGSHIVYLSRYFAQDDYLFSASKKDILSIMIKPLTKIYPQFRNSWLKKTYVFRSATAATVCGLNFSGMVPQCRTPIENLFIVNMSHIYPDERSCNNAIRIAANACRTIGIDSSMVPSGTSLSGQIGMI